MRKTKIVCTLGPASDSEERIHSLICAGMDVARFNFSHGSHESHKATFERVSRLREELRLPVATLLDTKGPEIRLGVFKGGKAELHAGSHFTLTADECEGDETRASITFPGLAEDVGRGDTILLNDGAIELRVTGTHDGAIDTEIVNGGVISDHKGVNVPGVDRKSVV